MIPIPLIIIGLVIGAGLIASAADKIGDVVNPEPEYSTKNKNYDNSVYKTKAKQIMDILDSASSLPIKKYKNEELKNIYNVFFKGDNPCLNKDDIFAVLNNIKIKYRAFWSTILERNFFEEIKTYYWSSLEYYKKLKEKFDSYGVYGL